MKAIPVL